MVRASRRGGYGSSGGKAPGAVFGEYSAHDDVPVQGGARSWLAQGIAEAALEEERASGNTEGQPKKGGKEAHASGKARGKESSSQSERQSGGSSRGATAQQGRPVVEKVTFYEELGVARDAGEKEIRAAWRRKALETHPDKCPNEEERAEYAERFKHFQVIYETLECERSRAMYDAVHLKEMRTGRILVLMDMNGSLLYKADRDDLGTKAFASVLGGRKPDWIHKDKGFYLRPYAKEFLEAVLRRDSKLLFAIYTSRQFNNAEPQVLGLGDAIGKPQLMSELFALYAGDAFSVPDPQAGKFKSKRCLHRIWRDRATCARVGMHLDHCNTLNLDSEARKLKDHPENGLVVPAYTAQVVRDEALSGRKDTSLLALRDYVLRLGLECHGDVRDYMRLFPFSTSGELKKRELPGIDQLMAEDLASGLRISD